MIDQDQVYRGKSTSCEVRYQADLHLVSLRIGDTVSVFSDEEWRTFVAHINIADAQIQPPEESPC